VTHFACHGHADSADPAASYLVLPDYETSPLTVADISALRIVGGLAYLSACDTGVSRLDLADEAVHITGAFHLAGYQQVIGTMWPIGDAIAAGLTRDFYGQLTGGGTGPPDAGQASYALHHAVWRLRRRFPAHPSHWAPFTHTGS
jgi:CHAT domain-containing protein